MQRILTIALFFCLSANTLMAETLTPQETVRLLITSIQKNDLQSVLDTADLVKIASHPRHARDPKDLVAYLKKIDLKKLQFQQIKISPLPQQTTIRVIAPISCDFDVVLQKATQERQEDHYMIVAVHP